MQSLSISPDEADASHVVNAAFSGFSAPVVQADGTSAVVAESGSLSFDNGSKLMPIDTETNAVQQSPREATTTPSLDWSADEDVKPVRGWRKTFLIVGGVASALLIGLGLKQRKDMQPIPVRIPKPPLSRVENPHDPSAWPRG